MKHSLRITNYLVLLFFVAQIVGLVITNAYLDHMSVSTAGEVVIINSTTELAMGTERPETNSSIETLLYLVGAVFAGTVLLLILIKFKQRKIWKSWFYLAVTLCIMYSSSTLFKYFLDSDLSDILGLVLGLVFAYFKVIKNNVLIHNISEVLIYGALGAIFVPMDYMNVKVGFILLIIISLYDMFAVWQSKHMVKLAKFQTDSKVFAGLCIPYKKKDTDPKIIMDVSDTSKKSSDGSKTAILGGGDIAFPLLFTGVVMKDLMLSYPVLVGFLISLIISVTSAVALFFLLVKAEKGKFYPAMPFISAGCFLGYFIVYILLMFI